MRCKHLNGVLSEIMVAYHERTVENGLMEDIGYNNVGEITGYEYKCLDCGKAFMFSYSGAIRQKWLKEIFEQLR